MAFTAFESETNAKAVAQFVAKRRPPEHIRARLDLGIEEKAQAFEVFSLVPHYQKKNTTMRNNVARVRFVRSRDEWRLYWQRADLRWHLYEPDPVHSTLHHALRVIDEDKYGCFFG